MTLTVTVTTRCCKQGNNPINPISSWLWLQESSSGNRFSNHCYVAFAVDLNSSLASNRREKQKQSQS